MKRPPLYTIGILAVCAALLFVIVSPAKSHSVEVGFTALSPSGSTGGQIVPASCNGGANAADYGQSCSASDVCGTNTSTYDTCGNCQAVAPTVPGNYGQTCNGVGTITCSGTCSVPSTPPTVSISSGGNSGSNINVLSGNSATITWSCPSPNTSASGANFSTGGAVSGSANVTVTNTTTYTVVCGQTGSQASVTATAINPTMSLVAAPSRVHSGSTSTLTWSASNVTSCTLSGPSTSVSVTATGGSISTQNTTTAPITGQSTFTLTCQTSAGAVSTSVNVSLIPVEIEI